MLNRRAFVSLAAGAAGLAACGRQVTPDPSAIGNNNLSGKMVIRFRVRGTLDFVNVNYVIVFNTSGNGQEPYPQAYLTSYANYSYSFAVGANYGGAGVTLPSLFQYLPVPGSANLNPRIVPLGASTTQLIPQDSIAGNEFQLTFTREQLNNPLQFQTPAPGATVSAGPTGTPTASPTPSATPSGFAPTPSPVPLAQPTSQAQRNWLINFFTLDRSGAVIDSLGLGGPTDTSFVFNIDTSMQQLFPVFRPAGVIPPSNTSAYIDGGEIDNYP